jgi:uracil-DNA glycosylase family 4
MAPRQSRTAGGAKSLQALAEEIVACERCPRLREHCRTVARVKRRAYLDWEYWGRPVPGFGDPKARVLLVGLAPGAHGANRTGRMFTGDGSGDFLYRALYETGFASQAEAFSRNDGLELRDVWITAGARCAPPGNKPTPKEFSECSCFLERELLLLHHVQVVVVLGRLALDAYLTVLKRQNRIASRAAFGFAHGAFHALPGGLAALLCSYHPSRQNTQTGRLTQPMLQSVFSAARRMLR